MTDEDRHFLSEMRSFTQARIGLGRAGAAIPTAALLDLQMGSARARDAVHAPFEIETLERALEPVPSVRVASRAEDRKTYLMRPDLGRRLLPASASHLAQHFRGDGWDVVFVLANGLSPLAAENHGLSVVRACLDRLQDWRIAPIVLARFSRVALADEIGEILNASMAVILLGERPGLTVSDSLAAYITWAPRVGVGDNQRNCISNIHGAGLTPEVAADKVVWLMREARRLRLSGVGLKEDAGRTLGPPSAAQLGSKPRG